MSQGCAQRAVVKAARTGGDGRGYCSTTGQPAATICGRGRSRRSSTWCAGWSASIWRHASSAPGTNVLQTSGLTARQREVLMLAVRGATNSDISVTLGISLATETTHLRHAFAKLRVADCHEALLLVMNARPPQPVSRRTL